LTEFVTIQIYLWLVWFSHVLTSCSGKRSCGGNAYGNAALQVGFPLTDGSDALLIFAVKSRMFLPRSFSLGFPLVVFGMVQSATT
jgi:hypothetical protein